MCVKIHIMSSPRCSSGGAPPFKPLALFEGLGTPPGNAIVRGLGGGLAGFLAPGAGAGVGAAASL